MNEIVSIDFAEKAEALKALHDMVPAAVQHAAEKIGPAGVLAFFDGYKEPQELFLLAASAVTIPRHGGVFIVPPCPTSSRCLPCSTGNQLPQLPSLVSS